MATIINMVAGSANAGVFIENETYGIFIQSGDTIIIRTDGELNDIAMSGLMFMSDDIDGGFWEAFSYDESSPYSFLGESSGNTLEGTVEISQDGDEYSITYTSETSSIALLFVQIS